MQLNLTLIINLDALFAIVTPVNKLKVSTTREVKNKSEVKFLKKYRLHAAQLIFFYFFAQSMDL